YGGLRRLPNVREKLARDLNFGEDVAAQDALNEPGGRNVAGASRNSTAQSRWFCETSFSASGPAWRCTRRSFLAREDSSRRAWRNRGFAGPGMGAHNRTQNHR